MEVAVHKLAIGQPIAFEALLEPLTLVEDTVVECAVFHTTFREIALREPRPGEFYGAEVSD
jgi:hypothetical protein